MLENRLDKAMIKYNEAQSIKKTYELVVKKLQEERLTFDKQLDNFEKSLQAKQQEATELDVMSRDANHAKEVARAELAQFEQQINDERKQREKDLQLRKEMVKHKLEMAEKSDKRVTKQEEQNLEATGKEGMTQIEAASEKKLSEYSEIMRLIKEVTGVSDITEVIAKFQSQEDTHKHLNNLQVANDKKIAHLKVKREEVIKELQELRFAGEAKQSHTQNSLKEFKAHLSKQTEEFKEIKQKYDRAMKVLNSAKAGVQHLADKIESIKLVLKS
jgi:chromosome segregation ATPase